MQELEQIFTDKNIDKTHIQFSGLDSTNAMSDKQKGSQWVFHVSPYEL